MCVCWGEGERKRREEKRKGEGEGDHSLIRALAKGQQLGWAPCRAPGYAEVVRTGKVKIIHDNQFQRSKSISTKSGGLSSSVKKQVI